MIKTKVELGARLSKGFDADVGSKVGIEIREAMKRISIYLQSFVKERKLSGQVLNVRTGTLRRSIQREVQEEANSIRMSLFTTVRYARTHEYGFSGQVAIPEHLRRGVGERGRYSTWVSAHKRRMNIPERSFLRSTLNENKHYILSELRKAVRRGMRR